MTDRTFRLLMAVLAAASAAIAGYLVYIHYTGGSIVCSTGGCETVQQSAYAEVFGVPVALIGLVGAIAILVTLVKGDLPWRAAGLGLAVTGLVFAIYLVVVQLAVIGSVCEWCVANDTIVAVLALVAGWRAFADATAGARA